MACDINLRGVLHNFYHLRALYVLIFETVAGKLNHREITNSFLCKLCWNIIINRVLSQPSYIRMIFSHLETVL